MSNSTHNDRIRRHWLPLVACLWPALGGAQVAVDEAGTPFDSAQAPGGEEAPLLGAAELQTLVGPIALYPDDLLAIVLPASTFPLQVVEAKRFLDALANDPSLEPDENWDDSVVALTNYPEAVTLLNDDLDWTWRLGEAVVAQQADVIAAIESFRDRAYAAGNLRSDEHQNVARSDGVIEITPVDDDVIYVPYYEPERVVVYQPRPVYYYYPTAYPVYYYPYPAGYAFRSGFFWGVTTAFSIGWYSDSLHVFHSSYYGHPYYGFTYWDRWWYRRPSVNIYNTVYVNRNVYGSYDRYRYGDYWHPHARRTLRYSDQRITRSRFYPGETRSERTQAGFTGGTATTTARRNSATSFNSREARTDIRFRERPESSVPRETSARAADTGVRRSNGSAEPRARRTTPGTQTDIRFRERPAVQARGETARAPTARRESAPSTAGLPARSRVERTAAEPRMTSAFRAAERREAPTVSRAPVRMEPRRSESVAPARIARTETRQLARAPAPREVRQAPRETRQQAPRQPTARQSRPAQPERVASSAGRAGDNRGRSSR